MEMRGTARSVLVVVAWLVFAAVAESETYDITSLGAIADGQTDASAALLAAWAEACASPEPGVVYVPRGRFLVTKVGFSGSCNSHSVTFSIDGTLVAPSNYQVIGDAGNWIFFDHVDGVTISGGVLDGQGTGLWDCKHSGDSCPSGATTLEFSNSKNINLLGVTSLNSQMFHLVINSCENVEIQSVRVLADGNSPNTDGIHVQLSTGVTILHANISTGDDCVSVGPRTSNLWIENIVCGPGHGVSVGSLGKKRKEAGVQNVTVKTATFTGTQNGLRIKSWGRPSSGFARKIHFQDVVMSNVGNPILIDQNYCPGEKGCPGLASGVEISDVTYQDIRGTSATEVAVKFDCSSENPCTNIRLEDINLTYDNKPAEASCAHAEGTTSGLVLPSIGLPCLA